MDRLRPIASIDADIAPFAKFIGERVRWSMEQATATIGAKK